MKPFILFLLLPAALVLSAPFAPAQDAPNFAPGKYILENGEPMQGLNLYTAPSVCDWNADGKKDLLVGVFYDGNVWVYPNAGADEYPFFVTGFKLMADGAEISVSYG